MAKLQTGGKQPKKGDLNAFEKARRTKSDLFLLGAIGGLTGEVIAGAILLGRFISNLTHKTSSSTSSSSTTPTPVKIDSKIPTPPPVVPEPEKKDPPKPKTTVVKTDKVIVEPDKQFKPSVGGPAISQAELLPPGEAEKVKKAKEKRIKTTDKDDIEKLFGIELGDKFKGEESFEKHAKGSSVERILKDNTLLLQNIDKNVDHFDKKFVEWLTSKGSEITADEALGKSRQGEFGKGKSQIQVVPSGKKGTEEKKGSSFLDDYFKMSLTKLAAQWGLKAGKALLGLFTSTLTKALSGTFIELGEGLVAAISAPVAALVIAAIGAGVATKINLDKLKARSNDETIKNLRANMTERINKGEKYEDVRASYEKQTDEEGKPLFSKDQIDMATSGDRTTLEPGTARDLSATPEKIQPLGPQFDTSSLTLKKPDELPTQGVSFEEQQRNAVERASVERGVSFEEQQRNAAERAQKERENSEIPTTGVSTEEQQRNAAERAAKERTETQESQVEALPPVITTLHPIDQSVESLPPTPKKMVDQQKDNLVTTIKPLSPPKAVSANVETAPNSENLDLTKDPKNPKKLAKIREKIKSIIKAIARQAGVPVALALSIAQHESNFEPWVKNINHNKDGSTSTDYGTFQLNDSVIKTIGQKDPNNPVVKNPFDLIGNIKEGVNLLKTHYTKHKGDINKTILAYARGEGTEQRAEKGELSSKEIESYGKIVGDRVQTMNEYQKDPFINTPDLQPKEISSLEMLPPNPGTGNGVRNASIEADTKRASNQKPIIVTVPGAPAQQTSQNVPPSVIVGSSSRNTEDTFNRANDHYWRQT
jgi:hypothetical protein